MSRAVIPADACRNGVSGLIPTDVEVDLPLDTRWHPAGRLPPMGFDHRSIVRSGVDRLRAKLSYTNIAFALAPETFTMAELRDLYTAVLGPPGLAHKSRPGPPPARGCRASRRHRPTGRRMGRPAALYRFTSRQLAVTDPFPVFRPGERCLVPHLEQPPTQAAGMGRCADVWNRGSAETTDGGFNR